MREVFQLIKSLSANEKKYFKRYRLRAEQKELSNIEILFNILDEVEEYDSTKIEARIKRAKLEKQATETASYLFEVLTESLVWYNRQHIDGLSNYYELAKMKLLEDRGLDKEALRLSKKLFPQVLNNGGFVERWNILGKNIYNASNEFLSDKKSDYETISGWIDKRSFLLTQMDRFHQYDSLLVQQLGFMRKAMQARTDDDLQQLSRIFENPLVADKQLANSDDSRFIFHTIRLHHFYIFQHWNEFYTEAGQLVNYISHEAVKKFETMRVLWAYAQLTQACYFTGNWAQLEFYLGQLNGLAENNQTEKIARFTYYTQLAITLFDHQQDEGHLLEILNEAVSHLKEFKDRLRPDVRLAITITTASAFIEYGQYGKAIDLCEDFLMNYDTDIRLDALLMLYVMEFISHIELGNTVYLNNTIQNVYRYFLRNDYKGEFEGALLKIFKKVSEIDSIENPQAEYEKLVNEWHQITQKLPNQQHITLLPIVKNFLLAKADGMPMHKWAQLQRTGQAK